jgi:hypothetical protein
MEVNDVKVLIGLITRNSLSSPYVLFELGARWGAGLFMVPLLAGVTPEEVRGPLSGLNALSCSVEAQLHQMLADVSNRLEIPVQSVASYLRYLKTVKETADAMSAVPAEPAPEDDGGAGAGALPAVQTPQKRGTSFSAQEERIGHLVAEKLEKFSAEGRRILRYILDHGAVNRITLEASSPFDSSEVGNTMVEGFVSGLLVSAGQQIRINPRFESALTSYFETESV